MSSYVHVFLRVNTDTFVQIACGSRSTPLYHYLSRYAPYEHIAQLSATEIGYIRESIAEDIRDYRDTIAQYEQMIRDIGSWNNPVDVKLETIHDYRSGIQDINEEIAGLERLKVELDIFEDMVDPIYYDEDEPMRQLWVGEECGSVVSVNDIEETP